MPVRALGEIAVNESRQFDFSKYDEVVFINTGDVFEGKVLHSDLVSNQGLPGQAKKKIEKGDILFSEIRPGNKRYALVDFEPDGYVVSTKFMVIRLTAENIDPDYFYKVLTSAPTLNEFQRVAESRSGTFPQITFDAISYFPFDIPSVETQKAIAHILGTLDDKIELNRQMNATLESMAQALFKSWFVDFDPVIDNALEAGNPIPESLHARAERRKALGDQRKPLPEHIQNQFPSSFVFSEEMGWVPEGWGVDPLSDFGAIVCGKTPPKAKPEYFGEDVPFIKIPDMHSSMFVVEPIERLSTLGAQSQAKKMLPRASVCVSSIATVGKVVITTEESQTNQQINSIIPASPSLTAYLYFYMQTLDRHFHDLASGGSATLNMNTGTFSRVKATRPGNIELMRFASEVEPMLERIECNLKENVTLADLRDTLLPKLLSGQICVADAEKVAAEAI